MSALTYVIRPDGSAYASPPFYDRIEVDTDIWASVFNGAYTLNLKAENGEPVVYALEDEDEDTMTFVRAVSL